MGCSTNYYPLVENGMQEASENTPYITNKPINVAKFILKTFRFYNKLTTVINKTIRQLME